MSKMYDVRPSVILDIKDGYTSYCFDEACAYIISRIKQGEEPDFSISKGSLEKPHYKSLKDMYKSMGYSDGKYIKQEEQ
mgnify:CR=1 FL=1